MQFESHMTGQFAPTCNQGVIQNFHALGQGFKETLFFIFQSRHDLLFLRLQARVGITHQRHQIGHQLVEERFALAEFVAVANGAADDAALHIAAAIGAGQHTVADQKGRGANMVGNDFERRVIQIGAAGLARSGFNQRGKQVDFVVAVHMLQDSRQAL